MTSPQACRVGPSRRANGRKHAGRLKLFRDYSALFVRDVLGVLLADAQRGWWSTLVALAVNDATAVDLQPTVVDIAIQAAGRKNVQRLSRYDRTLDPSRDRYDVARDLSDHRAVRANRELALGANRTFAIALDVHRPFELEGPDETGPAANDGSVAAASFPKHACHRSQYSRKRANEVRPIEYRCCAWAALSAPS